MSGFLIRIRRGVSECAWFGRHVGHLFWVLTWLLVGHSRLVGSSGGDALKVRLVEDPKSVVPVFFVHVEAERLCPVFFSGCFEVEEKAAAGPESILWVHPVVGATVRISPTASSGKFQCQVRLLRNDQWFAETWMQGTRPTEQELQRLLLEVGQPEKSNRDEDAMESTESGIVLGSLLGRTAVLVASMERWRGSSPVSSDILLRELSKEIDPEISFARPSGFLGKLRPQDRDILQAFARQIPMTFSPAFAVGPEGKRVLFGTPNIPWLFLLLEAPEFRHPDSAKVRLLRLGIPGQPIAGTRHEAQPRNTDLSLEAIEREVGERVEKRLETLAQRSGELSRQATEQLALEHVQNQRAISLASRRAFFAALGAGILPRSSQFVFYPLPGGGAVLIGGSSWRRDGVPGFPAPWSSSDPTAWYQWYLWRSAMKDP